MKKLYRLVVICLALGTLSACVPYPYYGYRQVEYRGQYHRDHYNHGYHSYHYYRHSGGQGYRYYPR